MSTAITLDAVTVNAPDALAPARFYAGITGGTARGDARFATVRTSGTEIGFQQVGGFRPPSWPSGGPPMQILLDFLVDDLTAAEPRVLAAGATRYAAQPNADRCLVYADPVGHPFCLTLWDGGRALAEADGSDASSTGVGPARQ